MPLVEGPGRFFNQCIQKKGLTDFTDGMLVAVIGGCEGSAVLAVVELNTKVTSKSLKAIVKMVWQIPKQFQRLRNWRNL